jgi:hypothetical protein
MAKDPKAEIEISAHSRGLKGKLLEARAKFATFGSELKKNIFGKDLVEKGFFGKAGAQMVGSLGVSAVSALGGFLLDQGKEVFAFNDQLTRLQIATGKTPETIDAFGRSIRRASDETGIGANQILAGARAYVALTGDMNGAIAKQRLFAQTAQATESAVGDIAATGAALKQNLGIDDIKETEAAFSALAIQGKEGAVELKDLAGQLANIAPQWAQFKGGKGLGGLKEMGAALQVVKRGFGGDAGETVTGLQSLLTAIMKNGRKFEKSGIKVFDKDPKTGAKTMRNVLDIVRDIGESKLVKDPTKLEKAFGRVEAYRVFIQLSQNRDVLDDLIAKSSDAGVIQRDLGTYLNSTAGRVATAWEGARNKIAEAFTPERIEAFASAVAEAIGRLADVIDKVSRFGTALRQVLGGKTDDEKAEDKQARYYEERQMSARLALNAERQAAGGDLGDLAWQELREKQIKQRIGQEDALRTQIQKDERFSGIAERRDPAEVGFVGRGFGVVKPEQNVASYSVAELGALRNQVKGTTQEAVLVKVIDEAIIRAKARDDEFLAALKALTTGFGLINRSDPAAAPVVKLDGTAVGKGVANARGHAGRPGK